MKGNIRKDRARKGAERKGKRGRKGRKSRGAERGRRENGDGR